MRSQKTDRARPFSPSTCFLKACCTAGHGTSDALIHWASRPTHHYGIWATRSLVIGCCAVHKICVLGRQMVSIKEKDHSEKGVYPKVNVLLSPLLTDHLAPHSLFTWCTWKELSHFTFGNGPLLLVTDYELWNMASTWPDKEEFINQTQKEILEWHCEFFGGIVKDM